MDLDPERRGGDDGGGDDLITGQDDLQLGDGLEDIVPRDIKSADNVFDLAFHPANNYLVLGRVSGFVDVYEYKTGHNGRGSADTRQLSSMRMHDGSVRGLEFSEDGQYLVTAGSDRRIKVFDCNAQKTIIDIGGGDEVSSKAGGVTLDEDGGSAAAAFAADGAVVKKTKRHGTNAMSAAEILKKRKAAGSGAAAPAQHRVKNPHEAPISSINICSETLVATGDDEGMIVVWDMRTASPAHKYMEHGDYVSQMLYFAEVDQLVSTSGDTCLGCYSLRGGKMIDVSDPRKDELNSLVFIAATSDIVCGTPSGRLPIFRYGSWARPFDVHATHPKDGDGLIAYNDNIFLTGANDGTVRVVQHYPTRSLLTHLGGREKRHFPITRIRISHDRNMVAYCGEERYVQFQDIEFLSSETEIDKLRTRAEARHMATLRRVNEMQQQQQEQRNNNDNDSVRANNGGDDDENWEDDDDDDSDDSAWTESSDDDDSDDDDDDDSNEDDSDSDNRPKQQKKRGRAAAAAAGNNDDDDDDGEDDLAREADRRRAKVRSGRKQGPTDYDAAEIAKAPAAGRGGSTNNAGGNTNNNGGGGLEDDPFYVQQLTRNEKRARVEAANWLKEAQKTRVNFKRENGKKRVRSFFAGLN